MQEIQNILDDEVKFLLRIRRMIKDESHPVKKKLDIEVAALSEQRKLSLPPESRNHILSKKSQ